MALRGSEHYIWSSDYSLGSGGIGTVYRGRNKQNGQLVAVKQFKRQNLQRKKELDIARRPEFTHKNIVRILGVEKESVNHDYVLVMEYCPRGSVYTLISQPQYMRGITEELMIRLIFNLVDAIQYLHIELALAHRDIKPGNVLCCQGKDGKTVFKLSDFGTFREMQESRNTESADTYIEGTEEYIYPDMFYHIADHDAERKFAYSPIGADRWSLGVTLYEAATGSLPFTVPGGRDDRKAMKQLLEGVKEGIISGRRDKDGKIEYDNKLPDTCRLSRWLSDFLEVLLCGVLRTRENQWSDVQMFSHVAKLRPRLPVYVFNVQAFDTQRLYIKQDDRLSELKEEIHRIFQSEVSDDELLVHGCPILDLVTHNTPVSYYPDTSEDMPIIVCSLPTSTSLKSLLLHPVSDIQFESELHFDHDVQTGKRILGDILFLLSMVKQWNIASRSMDVTILVISSQKKSDEQMKQRITDSFTNTVKETKSKVNWVECAVENTSNHNQNFANTLCELHNQIKSIELLNAVAPTMQDTPLKILQINNNHMLLSENQCKCCVEMHTLVGSSEAILGEMREQRQQKRIDKNSTQLQTVLRHRLQKLHRTAIGVASKCHGLIKEKHTKALALLMSIVKEREGIKETINLLTEKEKKRQEISDQCNEVLQLAMTSSKEPKTPFWKINTWS